MSRRQRLFNALKKTDRGTYNGGDTYYCLIGQLARKDGKFSGNLWEGPRVVARRYGVAFEAVNTIFEQSAEGKYRDNLDAALEMAAVTLGLS